jgi:penicillin amidase
LRYDPQSRGATLFEAFYQKLLERVFGERLFGLDIWKAFLTKTNLLGVYFQIFDEALLGSDESWFGPAGREAVFRQVLEEVLAIPPHDIKPWGRQRQITMHNLFFRGKLPNAVSQLFGIDYGPVALPGGRATIVQGQIFETHGRQTTFAPSYRAVSDLGTNEVHTALAGGPSGQILSGLYKTDISRWLRLEYKTLPMAIDRDPPR